MLDKDRVEINAVAEIDLEAILCHFHVIQILEPRFRKYTTSDTEFNELRTLFDIGKKRN